MERTKGTGNPGERGEGGGNIDHLSAYVIMAGNPPPPSTLVLVQNKPTWSTVNQWAPEVNIVLFRLINIA